MESASILVLGATGRVGRLIVPSLLARGRAVRALVRDADAARRLLGNDVAWIEGDLRDPAALREAAQGCTTILFVAAAFGGPGRGTPREIDYGAVASLAGMLDPEMVERFVLLSSAGVTQPEHPHNCTFNSLLKWKGRGEEALRLSGVPYTIVRALGLRERPGGQQGVRIVQGDRIAFGEDIACEDLAAFLADVVAPHPATGFAPGFDGTSLTSATCEVFNDAGIAGGVWDTRLASLHPDPQPLGMGMRP